MAKYKGGNHRNMKRKINKRKLKILKKRIAITGASVLLSLTPFAREYIEQKQVDGIEQNAEFNVMRSFKNIDKEKTGKYLENEITKLYEKYPNLDDMIYGLNEATQNSEFIEDIYRLYKAYMVDEAEKDVESIENVKVTVADRLLVMHSDMIEENTEEGKKDITETHKEQCKFVTDKYRTVKEETNNGADLAKIMYEFLANQVGLEKGALTSEEKEKEIEDKGFYYDGTTNTFYTEQGKAVLVNENEAKQHKEKIVQMKRKTDDELEQG